MGEKKKILVIDDEELVIKSLEKLLAKEGYEVVSVRNGSDAMKKIDEANFDLIITDIRMPRLNGIELLSQIREVVKRKGCSPISEICITGYADDEINRKAEALGVADYLYKPFDLRDFLACVKKNLKA